MVKRLLSICRRVVNNASPMFPGNFQRALDEFDVNEDGLIDYNEFVELDRRYPLVLFPAFKLQDMMQKYSLGECTRDGSVWVGELRCRGKSMVGHHGTVLASETRGGIQSSAWRAIASRTIHHSTHENTVSLFLHSESAY